MINLKLPTTATQAIDSWLETNLSDPPDKLERALDLIAEAGSPSSSHAEIARYLLASAIRRGVFLDSWENPKHTDEWYSSRRADPTTKPLIERFIRKVLPWSHSHYTESFARDLLRLAPDLSQAFLDAAIEIVHLGVTHNDDPIAEGALEDLAGYENYQPLRLAGGRAVNRTLNRTFSLSRVRIQPSCRISFELSVEL